MANGKNCKCAAMDYAECACDADWTPQEVYDLRTEVASLKKQVEELKTGNNKECKMDVVGQCDTYEDYVVPYEDVAICLKVIRTARNMCLNVGSFDADGAVILSHAHAKLAEMVEECDDDSGEKNGQQG